LIECCRTDDRMMFGAEGEAGEGVSWISAIFVIVVSNPCLYGGAQDMRPL
jgi:hypothetical protein